MANTKDVTEEVTTETEVTEVPETQAVATDATEEAPTEEEPEAETAVADEAQPEPETKATKPAPKEEAKEVSLNQLTYEVETAVEREMDRNFYGDAVRRFDRWHSAVWTYPEYAIVKIGLQYFRANYTIMDGKVEMTPAADWPEVEQTYVDMKRLENTVVVGGDEVKALGQGMIGGYLVKFTDADHPDLEGDWFDASTDFGPHRKSIVYYGHGLDQVLGLKRLGDRFGLAELKIDDAGVWLQHQLDMADEYERLVYELTAQKKLGFSSGTASHLVRRTLTGKSYHIDSWPLGVDASLTPQPAAGPGHTQVIPLKSFVQDQAHQLPSLKALLQELPDSSKTAATAAPDAALTDSILTNEELNMTPEELKQIVSEAVQTAVAPVQQELDNVKANLAKEPATNDPGFDTPEGGDRKSFDDVMYNIRYGGKNDGEVKELVLNEVAGGNYPKFVWEQNRAFAKYVREGEGMMEVAEKKLLKNQVFAPTYIMKALGEGGMDVRSLKDTMVEAQGSLGGYAVPPNMQENIAQRLPGLTAVRGNGARVITLIRGNSTEVPVYSGGNERYVGNIRGQWGTETQAPGSQNATLEMQTVNADIYTYKIPMSTSLAEDAMNLVQLVEDDIVMTVAMDEDEAFLVGDGVGKPLGWLPGGLNSHSLANTTVATTFTAASIKALRRKLATQYRGRAVFVANSDSYGLIEALTVSGTGSDYAFPGLSEDGRLLRAPATESEAMPDVATSAFPMLYVDQSGYYIIERAGLTVMRMQDSYTGINKVELHVRKRVGGRPVEIWKAAALQTT